MGIPRHQVELARGNRSDIAHQPVPTTGRSPRSVPTGPHGAARRRYRVRETAGERTPIRPTSDEAVTVELRWTHPRISNESSTTSAPTRLAAAAGRWTAPATVSGTAGGRSRSTLP